MELREHAVRMYRAADPKPQIKKVAVDLGVHPEALRGWIRRPRPPARWGERPGPWWWTGVLVVCVSWLPRRRPG
ncbi:transposase [Streptomyces sp. GbtcB6]|uniref:transposase n=1 Tax=Streptomyces sp. GbtcB6 TaxID=2824751 RepID=UPI0034D700FC